MFKKLLLLFAGLCLCSSVTLAAPVGHPEPVMTAYRDALLAQFDKLETTLPDMAKSADAVAARIIAGGNLYAGGHECFEQELFGRAGGLMCLAVFDRRQTELTNKDVLLVDAWTNTDEVALDVCRRAKKAGAYVVLFSPASFESKNAPLAGLCDDHIMTFATADPAIPIAGGKRIGPTGPIFAVTTSWTYSAELISAFTRQGKTAVVWQSIGVPGGNQRNAKYGEGRDLVKARFHTDMNVAPVPAGVLGREYLSALRRQAGGLREGVLSEMEKAAGIIAAALRDGKGIHVRAQAHFTRFEVINDAYAPDWTKAHYLDRYRSSIPPAQLVKDMKPGDVFFLLGYHDIWGPHVQMIRQAGAKSIWSFCHAPVVTPPDAAPDAAIDSQWDYGDAAIVMPGYDVRILPASAVMQTAVYWTIVAKVEDLRTQTAE